MDKFTVRVELHGLHHEHASYGLLHAEMEKEGFSRIIVGNDGKEYDLPPGEYNKLGRYTGEQIRQSAARAASATVKGTKFAFAILVTPSTGRYWQGLQESN